MKRGLRIPPNDKDEKSKDTSKVEAKGTLGPEPWTLNPGCYEIGVVLSPASSSWHT